MEPISTSKLLIRLHELNLPLITSETISSVFNLKNQNTVHKILQRLLKKNLVYRLDKGKYVFKDKVISEFNLANLINLNSYISFESALSFYGILPQFTYSITSATTSKNRSLKVQNQIYEFTSINPNLFWGYIKNNDFLIATPEKALLDSLYISSKGKRKLDISELDFSSINKDVFEQYGQKITYPPLKKLLTQIHL